MIPFTQSFATLSGYAMLAAWATVLGGALFGLGGQGAAIAALLLFLTLQLPQTAPGTRVHLAVGAGLALWVLAVVPAPGATLSEAALRACFVSVLFAALGVLQTAVAGAPRFIAAGEMLVRQPSGRRYFALSGGSALFGGVLNFGVLPLFGSLVQRARPPDSDVQSNAAIALRERRMLVALLRGFSVVMFWCPLTMAYAITTTTIEGANWLAMVGFGLAMAVAVLILGRFFGTDRSAPVVNLAPAKTPFSFVALLPVLVLLLVLSALAAGVEEFTAGRLVHGVILFVPLAGLVLLAYIRGWAGLARLGQYIAADVPTQRNEIAVLGNAAFCGALLAVLLPEGSVGGGLQQIMPVAMIPALCLALVVLLGQAGLNPLISVAVLASTLADAAAIGLDPTVFAVALTTGWGLTIGSSSAAAATMVVGRLTAASAWTVGTRWNGAFTLAATATTMIAVTALALLR
ncbi:MAG: hypothetical protein JJT95_05135 [Pararhodobacter sp.]|nr:hypothetical protein [Pararhodobacter sp.]